MQFVWTLIIGLIVGGIAKFLMPGKDPGGFIITILLGIAGSFVGTFIGRRLGMFGEGGSTGFTGFIMSVIGAIILLAIYRFFKRKAPAS
ncbi:MAG TPA: GlsB/YeaQ/YmgE family stress response membrane protein [Bryobacteraceae bacterium]|jgi:uncharacterized membrane protein YeaQ/YmgE (transglycosylase-associated protein family)